MYAVQDGSNSSGNGGVNDADISESMSGGGAGVDAPQSAEDLTKFVSL